MFVVLVPHLFCSLLFCNFSTVLYIKMKLAIKYFTVNFSLYKAKSYKLKLYLKNYNCMLSKQLLTRV